MYWLLKFFIYWSFIKLITAINNRLIVTKILSSDQEIRRNEANIYMSYRLIDVATKQINHSNTIQYKIQLSQNAKKPDTEIISKISKN